MGLGQVVDSPAHFPGCCEITRSAEGPFLDLERSSPYGERVYIQVAFLREMAETLGLGDTKALDERIEELDDELAQVIAERDGALGELAALRASVRYTLLNGGVRERDGSVKLRPVPGRDGVEVGA